MIYLSGDPHGDTARFRMLRLQGEESWTEEDTLIFLGDFGYVCGSDGPAVKWDFLEELASKPYTICFCDGNHENFDVINSCPVQEWNGGLVHVIRPNILHLMRGQHFTIEGKTFLTLGGAYSRDAYNRRPGVDWFPEAELYTPEDYKTTAATLKAIGNKVDFVLSHTCPSEIIYRMRHTPDPHDAQMTGHFDWVMYELGDSFKQWFFGHWHVDGAITHRFRCVWYDVIALREDEEGLCYTVIPPVVGSLYS
jgi:hypothetical protein